MTTTGETLRQLLLDHDIKAEIHGSEIVLTGRFVSLLPDATKRSLREMKPELRSAIKARTCRCPVCGRTISSLDLK